MKDLTAYDKKRAIFTENSILTTGSQDFYCRGVGKMGRRNIMRMDTFNDQGTQISVWQYITDITRAIKSGELTVYKK